MWISGIARLELSGSPRRPFHMMSEISPHLGVAFAVTFGFGAKPASSCLEASAGSSLEHGFGKCIITLLSELET